MTAKSLKILYIDQGFTLRQIASLAGVTHQTIYYWMKKFGISRRPRGGLYGRKRSANWKGGITRAARGYIQRWNPDHPYADKKGYVMEHRLIMEKVLGRYLQPEEVIHHKNGLVDDNRLGNLKLFTCQAEHMKSHVKSTVDDRGQPPDSESASGPE